MRANVTVEASPPFEAEARAVAAELGLAFGAADAGDLALVLDEDGWGLADRTPGAPGVVRCDLLAGTFGQRLRRGVGADERLARAMGLRAHPRPRVLDATAGLGRDSVIAAALGCEVIACERSPVVALLLRDGLARAAAGGLGEVVGRIEVRVADARVVMRAMAEGERPDVVIVDPMFPERPKAAKAKKELQTLQQLLDPKAEEASLLDAAIDCARRRVVVKRPAHAPAIGGRAPSLVVPGRAARFDVYVRP